MSNILRATHDEARGEVIDLGAADPSLPAMDWTYVRENLVVWSFTTLYPAYLPAVLKFH